MSPCTESELLQTHPVSVTIMCDGRHAAHLDGECHAAAEELARQRCRLRPEIRAVSRVINLTSLIPRRFLESVGRDRSHVMSDKILLHASINLANHKRLHLRQYRAEQKKPC